MPAIQQLTSGIKASCVQQSAGHHVQGASDIAIKEAIGHGHHGTVHRCIHCKSGKVMAVKRIPVMDNLNEKELKQIMLELHTMQMASQYPHIPQYYGAFAEPGYISVCMEYMDLGSLRDIFGAIRCRNPAFVVPEVVLGRIAAACVQGLQLLSRQLKIMHRDVKPANILVNSQGAVKLCDFGVSGKLISASICGCDTYIGTPLYMSPERISSQGPPRQHQYNDKADVWSVGVMLWEIATGVRPFSGAQSVFHICTAIITGPPLLEHERLLHLPCSQGFKDFLRICLERNPDDRATYDSMLAHPWLRQQVDDPTDLASWFRKNYTEAIEA